MMPKGEMRASRVRRIRTAALAVLALTACTLGMLIVRAALEAFAEKGFRFGLVLLALDYETRETPSLQGFVAWLRAAQSEVKRDMEMVRDEVRVMTVHGAKGLEAETVILADTTTKPTGPQDPRLLPLANGHRPETR